MGKPSPPYYIYKIVTTDNFMMKRYMKPECEVLDIKELTGLMIDVHNLSAGGKPGDSLAKHNNDDNFNNGSSIWENSSDNNNDASSQSNYNIWE